MKKINVILLIVWMGIIFLFSQDSAASSTEKSDTLASTIVNIVTTINPSSNIEKHVDVVVVFVRKTAHFLEYMILGLLIVNVLKDNRELNLDTFVFALIFCFLYACSDEIHQLFVSERAGRILDVLLDTAGSLTGILFYYFFRARKINEKKMLGDK